MKNRVLVAFFLTMAVATGTLKAQNNSDANAQVAEPQYINSFYALTPNGNLIELEYRNVAFHPRSWGVPGYASFKTVADFKPSQSPIRLPASAQFVVRGRVDVDPATVYELRMLKDSKSHRELVLSQAHGSIVGGSVNPEEGAIPIRFEEYGNSSFRVVPVQPLAPGEYALMVRGRYSQLYCFGVDGAKQ
ncbi:MAG: hypothetical protein WA532_14665 [Candidatus Korobacteraceae bacterium]